MILAQAHTMSAAHQLLQQVDDVGHSLKINTETPNPGTWVWTATTPVNLGSEKASGLHSLNTANVFNTSQHSALI